MKLMDQIKLLPEQSGRVIGLCALASAALLAGAHAFENFGGLAPCALCLDQREVHWVALAVALLSGLAFLIWKPVRAISAGLGVLSMVYFFSAGLSLYHSGVEWHLWPAPATCSSMGPVEIFESGDDLMNSLEQGDFAPACDQAAWRLMGISMAGYNALFSIALSLLTGFTAITAATQIHTAAFQSTGQGTGQSKAGFDDSPADPHISSNS